MVLDANVLDANQSPAAPALTLDFEDVFARHRNRVYSIALRFSGDHASALDISQQAFLKILSHLGDFRGGTRGESSFDAWLYRLVANACLDHHRSNRRWLPFVDEALEALQNLRGRQESALEVLVRSEQKDQIHVAIAKLHPSLRIVVVLRYTEGLSYEDIAGILHCPPGTVASRLNRAHKILERKLAHLRREA